MDAAHEVVMRFETGLVVRIVLTPGSPSAEALLKVLPFRSSANRWGDEVYFEAPFHVERERGARAEMEIGDVAFWPDGDAVAVFFGPTPVSVGPKPRAYSSCNVFGKVKGPSGDLRSIKEGTPVEVLLA